MLKPVCIPCRRFFRMKKSGFYFVEGMPKGNHAPPGTEAPDQWAPYKLWAGDVWACEGCGAEIISGTGQNPLGEHYQGDFPEQVARLGADLQVNDC